MRGSCSKNVVFISLCLWRRVGLAFSDRSSQFFDYALTPNAKFDVACRIAKGLPL